MNITQYGRTYYAANESALAIVLLQLRVFRQLWA